MVASRSSAKIDQFPGDVGIATELNLAGVGQCSAPLWEEADMAFVA